MIIFAKIEFYFHDNWQKAFLFLLKIQQISDFKFYFCPMQKFQKSFDDMDRLSEKEIPFFFIIDFLVENILVFQKEDLEENNISVAFPHFVNHKTVRIPQKEIQWTAFPQSKNSYQKGFEHIQKNLKEGNSYLMNYTCKTEIETNLSLEEIYYLSVAKYKVLFGDRWTFFSPETFI